MSPESQKCGGPRDGDGKGGSGTLAPTWPRGADAEAQRHRGTEAQRRRRRVDGRAFRRLLGLQGKLKSTWTTTLRCTLFKKLGTKIEGCRDKVEPFLNNFILKKHASGHKK